ncbi:MAG: thiamine pyrophosphate-requiring protein [Sulfolobus sp.]
MDIVQYILKFIRNYSGDNVFIVSGTDHPAFIKYAYENRKDINLIVIPHEITATSAALGYSLSGKLGVILLHTLPGTLNGLGIIANAFTSRIPLLVIAGKSPYTSKGSSASRNLRVHWTQDADQEAIIKNYVKYSFEIRDTSQVPATISRAVQIALSEPQGPVYIAIPREISIDSIKEEHYIKMEPYYPSAPQSFIEKAKKMIENSSNPVIVTWRAGRKESWFKALTDFANRAKIPIINYVGERVNYPSTGEMAMDEFNLKEADLIIAVEVEVPWIPKYIDIEAKVIRVDTDPSYSYIPYYDFPCDLCIQSSVDEFFNRLKVKRNDTMTIVDKIKEQKEYKLKKIEKLADEKYIHPDYLSFEISKLKWTIFNEYNFNPKYSILEEYNSYFGDPSFGHLGWALGASVGYKIATGKNVIAVVGDGSFIFGVPSAFYYIAKKIPVLVVIFDNKSWNEVEKSVKEVYPEINLSGEIPGVSIDIDNIPSTIEKIGGYYEYIEKPYEVENALNRGKEKVLSGIPAIIHARVTK